MNDQKRMPTQDHNNSQEEIRLSTMTDRHLNHLIELAKDPDLAYLMGWEIASDNTDVFTDSISSYAFAYSRQSQPIVFGIFLDLQALPIGYVVLKGLNKKLHTCEIGIAILDKTQRHKGYGTLASSKLITYAFDELNMQRIGAAILLSNKASIAMFSKLGFTTVDTLYESWPMPSGELADMVLMEITHNQYTLRV